VFNTRNKHSDVRKSAVHPAQAKLDDIACNTLPYAFVQLSLPPQIGLGGRSSADYDDTTLCRFSAPLLLRPHLRQPKRQKGQCTAITCFNSLDFFAQRRKDGQWSHDKGSLSNGWVMFLLCSRLPAKRQEENFFQNCTELFQRHRILTCNINFPVKLIENKTRVVEDGRPSRRRFSSVRSRLSDPTKCRTEARG
jgi:hypothetical protein